MHDHGTLTPTVMTVQRIIEETPDVKTFRLAPVDVADGSWHHVFDSGQFGLFSVFGQGEAPFGLASSPTQTGYIECSIKRQGKVTDAFHALAEGDHVGYRGPYGRGFPFEELKRKNVVFVGGGIGLAPLRSLIWNCLDNRADFGDLTVVYGARSTSDLVYKRELNQWLAREDMQTVLTVDPGGQDEAWRGHVGFVPSVLEEVAPAIDNTLVVTCGPPIMIKFVVQSLLKLGFDAEQIITSLEMKMKCGIGKCGRCNIGHLYVCKDGPVFTYAELKDLPDEY